MRALDPLTAEEKMAVERIALADPRVKELLGTGRRKLVSVELLALKPESAEGASETQGQLVPLVRHAEVIFFRYEGEFGVRAVVNLARRAVTEVSRLESRDISLDNGDLAEALQLALRDPEVKRALGVAVERFQVEDSPRAHVAPGERHIVRGLRVQANDEKDPCWKHRCLRLLFLEGDVYLSEPIVVVDLTAQKVYAERRK